MRNANTDRNVRRVGAGRGSVSRSIKMAHLWRISVERSWVPVALDAAVFAIGQSGLRSATCGMAALEGAVLRRIGADPHASWTLLVPAGAAVRVNGSPVPLGIVSLADRDEIRVMPGSPLFFSTETLAAVVPYPEDGPLGFCPRCQQPIAAGTPAVSCPGCGLWHHASEGLPCWTYGEQCAACQQLTALDAGFRWTPEEV
jgi:hypothetical protein